MRSLLLVAVSLAAACALSPGRAPLPPLGASPDWIGPASVAAPQAAWWRTLGDPVLSDLVDKALARNPDLRTAAAQVREARANRAAAFGPRLPQVELTGQATRNELSENGELPINRIPDFKRRFGLFDAGFDASWEIDFWGRNERGVAAADARLEGASDALHGVQIQVIAETVRTYVDLRSAQARLASATRDAAARNASATLVGERLAAGESSRSEAARASQLERSTHAQLAGLAADARAAAYGLALLTGRPPEDLAALATSAVPLPDQLPAAGVGLRSDLLTRRPDVRKAGHELAAATADVAVARADLFPRFTLLAAAGQQSLTTGNLLQAASARYQFGPSLTWPIFSAGRLRALVRAAGARADAAEARYEQAVLTALADSETAINRFAAAGEQRVDVEAALLMAQQGLDLARQRYDAGEDDRLALLDAESQYRGAEQAALTARAAQLTALVSLYKALGGGWEPTP